ncbi:MAG: hypothetical protein R8M45_08675 [Ghiorsea sp.]
MLKSFLLAHLMLIVAVFVTVASSGVWWILLGLMVINALHAWYALVFK